MPNQDESGHTVGRKAYAAPQLVDYGPLSSLTRGDSGKKSDDKATPTKK